MMTEEQIVKNNTSRVCKMMLATMAAKGMILQASRGTFKALLWVSAALCSVLCQEEPTLLPVRKFDIPQPFLFRLWIINGSTEGPDVSPDASLGSSYKTFLTNIFLGICL